MGDRGLCKAMCFHVRCSSLVNKLDFSKLTRPKLDLVYYTDKNPEVLTFETICYFQAMIRSNSHLLCWDQQLKLGPLESRQAIAVRAAGSPMPWTTTDEAPRKSLFIALHTAAMAPDLHVFFTAASTLIFISRTDGLGLLADATSRSRMNDSTKQWVRVRYGKLPHGLPCALRTRSPIG
jgi:hypothetical protein